MGLRRVRKPRLGRLSSFLLTGRVAGSLYFEDRRSASDLSSLQDAQPGNEQTEDQQIRADRELSLRRSLLGHPSQRLQS